MYGTPSLLVIAGIAGAIPYAVRVQLGAFGNLSGTMLRAAAIQGASIFDRMRHIVLPLVRQLLLIAALASFGSMSSTVRPSAIYPNLTKWVGAFSKK
ncbi:hypothetical protein [Paenibacillus terrae]|uniref:hypothetical protein n=1 Tax=Paenibacillus terrae TaxID=159743 RepID=UPI00207B44CC|nr:hypothetical protein [Paenibacillus terrae]